MNTLAFISKYRVSLVLGIIVISASLIVQGFFSVSTLSLGLDRASTVGLIAIGMCVILIAGQLDLSVGSVFALSGVVAIYFQPSLGLFPAAALGFFVGLVCGGFNAFLVVGLKINALVATLATMLIFRSVAHWVTGSQPLAGQNIMFSLELAKIYLGLFTFKSGLFILGILGLSVFLSKTSSGRNLFAVGSNISAANASGISSNKIISSGFVFSSGMAALAGVLQSLATNTGSPVFGMDLPVTVIAAVVVGGTRLEGGRGSAFGTFGGVLAIAALTTALEFESVPAYYQQMVSGSILILLVVLDQMVGKTGSKQARSVS